MLYSCPLCDKKLTQPEHCKYLVCENNHQFDQAKQGYFNLLPVQRKKSLQPGDSKEMIAARQDFLTADYYQPLAKELCDRLAQHFNQQTFTLLDLGCGEGYYSRQITQQLDKMIHYGIDISKPAIIKAAQQDKKGYYSVASSDKVPLQNDCIDVVLKVYAPANDAELLRVCKEDGLIITVMPGPRHLWQLREFIYDEVRAHDTQDTQFSGFELIDSDHIGFNICPSTKHRDALLQMTPFAWKASEQQTLAIHQSNDLTIELDFVINTYRVKKNDV